MPEILPLEDAVKRINAKTPIGSVLRSADWERVPLALRERAQFSAGVTSARVLQDIQDRLAGQLSLQKEQLANGKTAMFDRSSFIDSVRQLARDEGLTPSEEGKRGGLQDITSISRLGLIYDMQNQMATGYARWKMDQSEGALLLYPAWRLVREADRKVPRNWAERWLEAGEKVGWEGAVKAPWVALKNSPIWAALSRFGTPWPPFDYQSGMGVDDADRDEAIQLGLIQEGEIPEATGEQDFNQDLEASVKGLDPELKSSLKESFGDQIDISGDTVAWVGTAPEPDPQPVPPSPKPNPLPKPVANAGLTAPQTYDEHVERLLTFRADYDAVDQVIKELESKRNALREAKQDLYRAGKSLSDPEVDRLRNEILELGSKIQAEAGRRQQVIDRALEAISVSAAERAQVNLVAGKANQQTMEAARAGAEIIARLVAPERIEALGDVTVMQHGKARAFCSWGGKQINISALTSPSVAAHELMHSIEMRNPILLKKAAEFLFSRTVGETDVSLQKLKPGYGYGKAERARKDRWEERGGDVYSGKVYGTGGMKPESPDQVAATELLSMGIERLYKNPLLFHSTDPEYFAFIVKALKGLS